MKYGGGLLMLMVLLGVIGTFVNPPAPPASGSPATPSAAVPPATPKLQLLNSRGYETDPSGYHVVEGQVRNISTDSVNNVAAITTWYTKDDQFITADQALIDLTPILPGQTSTFKTMSRTNLAMVKYRVEFKNLLGGAIPTEDARKKK